MEYGNFKRRDRGDNRDRTDNRGGNDNRGSNENRGGGFDRDRPFDRDRNDNRGGGFDRDRGSGGGGFRERNDNRGGGFDRDRGSGGGGYNRGGGGGYNRGGGFDRGSGGGGGFDRDNEESVFSKRVRAGKRRTYFFDVKKTKGEDYFITITESTRREDGYGYKRHKIFLYKEDFNRFVASLNEVVSHVKTDLMPNFDYEEFDRRQAEWEAQNREGEDEERGGGGGRFERERPRYDDRPARDLPTNDTAEPLDDDIVESDDIIADVEEFENEIDEENDDRIDEDNDGPIDEESDTSDDDDKDKRRTKDDDEMTW